jgi:hypothetical protein
LVGPSSVAGGEVRDRLLLGEEFAVEERGQIVGARAGEEPAQEVEHQLGVVADRRQIGRRERAARLHERHAIEAARPIAARPRLVARQRQIRGEARAIVVAVPAFEIEPVIEDVRAQRVERGRQPVDELPQRVEVRLRDRGAMAPVGHRRPHAHDHRVDPRGLEAQLGPRRGERAQLLEREARVHRQRAEPARALVREIVRDQRDQPRVRARAEPREERAPARRIELAIEERGQRVVGELREIGRVGERAIDQRRARDHGVVEPRRMADLGGRGLRLVREHRAGQVADLVHRAARIDREPVEELAPPQALEPLAVPVPLRPRVDDRLREVERALVLEQQAAVIVVVVGARDQARQDGGAIVGERERFELLEVHRRRVSEILPGRPPAALWSARCGPASRSWPPRSSARRRCPRPRRRRTSTRTRTRPPACVAPTTCRPTGRGRRRRRCARRARSA